MGSRYHPHIGSNRLIAADALKFSLLQDSQQRDLGFGRQFSDFIEEERAPFGQLKAAQTALQSTGEGAFLMAEQFRRDQVARDGGAIDARRMGGRSDVSAYESPGQSTPFLYRFRL